MAAFCAQDPRLSGVALCDLDDGARSQAELDAALELGLGQVWIPARAPAGRSPGHPAHDAFWSRLAERGVPFVLHVGSGAFSVGDAWLDDGQSAPVAEGNRPEVIGSKDLMVIYQPIERFLSVLVLDGVLERHRALRGGAIEVGAGWVPDMLRRLDHAVAIWSKSEPRAARLRANARASRPPRSSASRRIRSRTSACSAASRTRACTCSRRTTRTPRAGAIRSRASTARCSGHSPEVVEGFYAGNAAGWLAPRV